MNLETSLARTAARLPDKPALRFGDAVTSYRELGERVARGAGALLGLGLAPGGASAPGDRVALLLGNTPAFVEVCFGALRAGLVAVPVNPGFTATEVGHVVADSGARVLVVDAARHAVADEVRVLAPELEQVVVVGDAPGGAARWEALCDAAEAVPTAPVEDTALALLSYTAGTTGTPKGAMLSHGNLLANHRQLAATRAAVEERDLVLCVLPLFHVYALNVVLAYTLARGATLLLVEAFDPAETLRAVERERATILVGAPPMYVGWSDTPGLEHLDLASIRYAVSGAAPLSPGVHRRFTARFGIPLWEGYGLTETGPVLTTTAMGDAPVPGSVGLPLPDVELRLLDGGAPVRPGDPGEVTVRGPNIFAGYWGDPVATRAVLDDDGWFRTGDIGYADEQGALRLVDRKSDLVIVSGFNVYPAEVENVLARHPGVAQAAVVGVPHPVTGERVRAFVVPAEGAPADADDVRDFARRHLARFKVPEEIVFVDELPQQPTGKLRRRLLRG